MMRYLKGKYIIQFIIDMLELKNILEKKDYIQKHLYIHSFILPLRKGGN